MPGFIFSNLWGIFVRNAECNGSSVLAEHWFAVHCSRLCVALAPEKFGCLVVFEHARERRSNVFDQSMALNAERMRPATLT